VRFVPRAVLCIDCASNLRHGFAFMVKFHRVTRDVEADVSRAPHVVPLRDAFGHPAFDKTIPDALVPLRFTSTVTGHVLQDFGLPSGKGIGRAHPFEWLYRQSGCR
jgi:hypothetical protein